MFDLRNACHIALHVNMDSYSKYTVYGGHLQANVGQCRNGFAVCFLNMLTERRNKQETNSSKNKRPCFALA